VKSVDEKVSTQVGAPLKVTSLSRGGLGWGWAIVTQSTVSITRLKPIPIPTFPLKGKGLKAQIPSTKVKVLTYRKISFIRISTCINTYALKEKELSILFAV
jgi:hypothetical protein